MERDTDPIGIPLPETAPSTRTDRRQRQTPTSRTDERPALTETQLRDDLAALASWRLTIGGQGVCLQRNYIFPTARLGQGFASLASGLALVFGHTPVWSVLGRVVQVSLADMEKSAVTSRELALARALNSLHRGFIEAGERIQLEGPLAPVLPYSKGGGGALGGKV